MTGNEGGGSKFRMGLLLGVLVGGLIGLVASRAYYTSQIEQEKLRLATTEAARLKATEEAWAKERIRVYGEMSEIRVRAAAAELEKRALWDQLKDVREELDKAKTK